MSPHWLHNMYRLLHQGRHDVCSVHHACWRQNRARHTVSVQWIPAEWANAQTKNLRLRLHSDHQHREFWGLNPTVGPTSDSLFLYLQMAPLWSPPCQAPRWLESTGRCKHFVLAIFNSCWVESQACLFSVTPVFLEEHLLCVHEGQLSQLPLWLCFHVPVHFYILYNLMKLPTQYVPILTKPSSILVRGALLPSSGSSQKKISPQK